MRLDLAILSWGLCSAVGLTAASSAAAIRARVDGFRETRFMVPGGDWLVGAEVPLEEPWRGVPRLAHLLAGPVRECLDAVPHLPPGDIPLLVGVAERGRPGRARDLDDALLHEVAGLLDIPLHPASALVPLGGGAAGPLLAEAKRLSAVSGVGAVILAGVDSLLTAGTLRALAEGRRLLTPATRDGLIPGEASAAVLLGRGPGPVLLGMGQGLEAARVGSGLPLRGDGLTTAVRAALDASGIGHGDVACRLSDLTGEQYGFKEAALAFTRVARDLATPLEIWHPADCIGAVGAAGFPVLLALAAQAGALGCLPGRYLLAQGGGDDGRRVAAVLDMGGVGT